VEELYASKRVQGHASFVAKLLVLNIIKLSLKFYYLKKMIQVMTKEDRFEARTGSKKQSQLLLSKYNKLAKPQEEERRKVAQEQKERLLEADRNVKKTTRVIDDQSDYFAVESPWLSKEERKATNDKKESYLLSKSRLHTKYTVTIDLAGILSKLSIY
jgi:hypothetical protein